MKNIFKYWGLLLQQALDFGDKEVIVSEYNNYEWITTIRCASIKLLFIAKLLQGHKLTICDYPVIETFKRHYHAKNMKMFINMFFTFNDLSLERRIPGDIDQITFHSPWSNI